MNDDDDAVLAVFKETVNRLSHLPIDDRLLVVQMAWMALAYQARREALAFPGGFPAAQARQVGHLEKIAHLVRTDTPDLELERLFQEGDLDAVNRYLRGKDGTS